MQSPAKLTIVTARFVHWSFCYNWGASTPFLITHRCFVRPFCNHWFRIAVRCNWISNFQSTFTNPLFKMCSIICTEIGKCEVRVKISTQCYWWVRKCLCVGVRNQCDCKELSCFVCWETSSSFRRKIWCGQIIEIWNMSFIAEQRKSAVTSPCTNYETKNVVLG